MSRLQRHASRARRMGVFPLRRDDGSWDVYVESEWSPRDLRMTRRQAIQFASCIASHPAPALRITYNTVTA